MNKHINADTDNRALSANRIVVVLFVLSVFLVALNKISDIDAWIHLSMGKLIWGLKGLPEKELYTYPITEFIYPYTSWIFGLLCYFLYTVSGAYGLVLLKATVITSAFYILLRDSLRPYNNYAVAVLVLTAALMLSRYRFVMRPDIFFILFLSFSIFSLNAYLYENKKYVYALPLMHLLWANIHTSIAVMSAPFMAFIVGGLIQHALEKRGSSFQNTPSYAQIKVIAIIFVMSFAASFISPYIGSQHSYGFKVLETDWYAEHILEMMPPEDIWVEMIAISALVFASFLLNRRNFSFIHFLLVVPFVFLTFSALRFTFVIAIVGFPVMARNISASLESKGRGSSRWLMVAAVAAIVLYCSFMTYRGIQTKEFGIGIDYSSMPKGAIEYMDRKEIYGRVLNPYAFGQYITWKSYPKRTVFVDGRGHMPVDLLEKMLKINTSTEVLDQLYEAYGFNSILTDYSHFDAEEKLPIAPTVHPKWALVYWDDISLLYLRRGGEYDSVIASDEYATIRPEVPPFYIIDDLRERDYRERVIEELKRALKESESVRSVRAHTFLGYAYYADGQMEKARENLSAAVKDAPNNASAHYGLALAYLGLGDKEMAKKHLAICLKIISSGELADEARRRLGELSSS